MTQMTQLQHAVAAKHGRRCRRRTARPRRPGPSGARPRRGGGLFARYGGTCARDPARGGRHHRVPPRATGSRHPGRCRGGLVLGAPSARCACPAATTLPSTCCCRRSAASVERAAAGGGAWPGWACWRREWSTPAAVHLRDDADRRRPTTPSLGGCSEGSRRCSCTCGAASRESSCRRAIRWASEVSPTWRDTTGLATARHGSRLLLDPAAPRRRRRARAGGAELCDSHLGVAVAVATGAADAGLAVRSVAECGRRGVRARRVGGLRARRREPESMELMAAAARRSRQHGHPGPRLRPGRLRPAAQRRRQDRGMKRGSVATSPSSVRLLAVSGCGSDEPEAGSSARAAT